MRAERRAGEGTRAAAQAAALVGLALALANCAGPQTARRGGNKYGVAPSPKVVADGEPIPKGGGREMVGKPYTVGGQTYVPQAGRGYAREGWASWYGTAFHGRLTANGEVFDRQSIAAAHPTLPLPSYVRVTNLVNKRSMVVRVNDRGPYERGRLIDVSEAAAEALEFRRRGTTYVRVEYLGKASLAGSDDAKLLATLRLDGSPAPYWKGQSPVMVASAPVAPRDPAPVRVAAVRPPESNAGDQEEEEPAPPPAIRRSLAASPRVSPVAVEEAELGEDAAPERPVVAAGPAVTPPPRRSADVPTAPPRIASGSVGPPVELLPPQRPALAGIY